MDLLTRLSKMRHSYDPLIRIELSKDRLISNLNEFKKLAPIDKHGHHQIAPVLKSNAYGHGLFEVAHMLNNENGIPFCIVDSYFEAVALRAKGFDFPLLVIGYTRPETILNSSLRNVSFTITSIETLRLITMHMDNQNSKRLENNSIFKKLKFRFRPKPVYIHLKFDTGMHRQGILFDEIDEVISLLEEIENDDIYHRHPVVLEGICSHLADADNVDESFTESQIHIWNKLVDRFKLKFPHIKYIHLAATDGHRFISDIHSNVSRLGIGLYGLSTNTELLKKVDLKPILEMRTLITDVKNISVGDYVGYGITYKALTPMTIATVPVGYYEGVDRRLSNSGFFIVGKDRVSCPIIGRVSMNITVIDVSAVKDISTGTEVVVISNDSAEENSIVNMSKKCSTISYEIAVHIPAHLKRVVV